MKDKIYNYKENPPTQNTWIWSSYNSLNELTEETWKLVKTCKRGCCVNFVGQSIVLPLYWKQASLDDIEKGEKELSNIQEVDFFDLLIKD